jgi:hypothetical protein
MSIDGTYRITADTPMGSVESTLILKTDGEDLSGTMSAGMMGTVDFDGGKVEGNSFSFATTMKKFFKIIKISGCGKVDGDQISGEVRTSMGNSYYSGVKI